MMQAVQAEVDINLPTVPASPLSLAPHIDNYPMTSKSWSNCTHEKELIRPECLVILPSQNPFPTTEPSIKIAIPPEIQLNAPSDLAKSTFLNMGKNYPTS